MIVFSGSGIDRAPQERADPVWLDARRSDPRARTVQLSERGVWMDDGHLLLGGAAGSEVFLGQSDGTPLFATDVTGVEPGSGRPAGLREAAVELPAHEAAVAAYAASLLSWHRRHRFCANCGAPTEVVDAGHQRRCPNCDAQHFPRTDPVVIVRVIDAPNDRLLLGRSPHWPAGRYSVLAGFVEPGETLEDAVRREVHEESEVELGSVSYVASQPWPFPSSLMLGFHALAEGGEPRPDGEELEDVRWFERIEVEEAARGAGPVMLSPPYSISRRLIDGWLTGESA